VKDSEEYREFRNLLRWLSFGTDAIFDQLFCQGAFGWDSQMSWWYRFPVDTDNVEAMFQYNLTLEEACAADPQPASAYYILTSHNCTDAAINAMGAAGLDTPNVSVTVGVIWGDPADPQTLDFPWGTISAPTALADYIGSLLNNP
jgi:hypothetical protein